MTKKEVKKSKKKKKKQKKNNSQEKKNKNKNTIHNPPQNENINSINHINYTQKKEESKNNQPSQKKKSDIDKLEEKEEMPIENDNKAQDKYIDLEKDSKDILCFMKYCFTEKKMFKPMNLVNVALSEYNMNSRSSQCNMIQENASNVIINSYNNNNNILIIGNKKNEIKNSKIVENLKKIEENIKKWKKKKK